jgi:glycosyltransferase involved in cell wall biosynthesis
MPVSNNNLPFFTKQKSTRIRKAKKKLLCWSDDTQASTGFATVSRHILKALNDTGEYDIDHLAINFTGNFYDKNKVPYTIVSSRLKDPSDPYGCQMFIDSLQGKDYDYVLIINDTFVVNEVATLINEIRNIKSQKKEKPFSLVYYYPVDCRIIPEFSTMIKVADCSVAYNNFGKDVTNNAGFSVDKVIYHGSDVENFHPISTEERKFFRKKYLGVDSDDTFVFINVARNSPRKDIARSILAFSEFKKQVTKDCLMYIHASIVDGVSGGTKLDLRIPIEELNLSITKDVIFPSNFHPGKGFSLDILNKFYNAADVAITTNLGEGYGIFLVEAMAVGIPVISPLHTSAYEIFGTDLPIKEQRGYLFECKERIYIDNSGTRPFAHMNDIVDQMKLAYIDWLADKTNNYPEGRENMRQTMIKNAMHFAHKYSWTNVCKDWVQLFKTLKPKAQQRNIGEAI